MSDRETARIRPLLGRVRKLVERVEALRVELNNG